MAISWGYITQIFGVTRFSGFLLLEIPDPEEDLIDLRSIREHREQQPGQQRQVP